MLHQEAMVNIYYTLVYSCLVYNIIYSMGSSMRFSASFYPRKATNSTNLQSTTLYLVLRHFQTEESFNCLKTTENLYQARSALPEIIEN